jgi:hypothetical protein
MYIQHSVHFIRFMVFREILADNCEIKRHPQTDQHSMNEMQGCSNVKAGCTYSKSYDRKCP